MFHGSSDTTFLDFGLKNRDKFLPQLKEELSRRHMAVGKSRSYASEGALLIALLHGYVAI